MPGRVSFVSARASVYLLFHGLSCADTGSVHGRAPASASCLPREWAVGHRRDPKDPSPRLWGRTRCGQGPLLSGRAPGPGVFRPLPAHACLSTLCGGRSSPPSKLLGRSTHGLRPRKSQPEPPAHATQLPASPGSQGHAGRPLPPATRLPSAAKWSSHRSRCTMTLRGHALPVTQTRCSPQRWLCGPVASVRAGGCPRPCPSHWGRALPVPPCP